MKDLWNS